MARQAKRLGRGLDSLVSDLRGEPSNARTPGESVPPTPRTILPDADFSERGDGLRATMLATSVLEPNPFQPRINISAAALRPLIESIRQSGILQPLTARIVSGRYQLVAGERRWRAAQSLSMERVPVIIRDATDDQMLEFALIENIQREDLNAIDRARAYQRFCTRFGLKPDEVAQRVGEDRSTVANYIRLLDLPETLQSLLEAGELGMGHARCLLGVRDADRQHQLAEAVSRKGLSVRALEDIVRRERTGVTEPVAGGASRTARPHVRDLERRFEEALKTKVSIHEGKRKGTGRITIEYFSFDDFERFAAALNVSLD